MVFIQLNKYFPLSLSLIQCHFCSKYCSKCIYLFYNSRLSPALLWKDFIAAGILGLDIGPWEILKNVSNSQLFVHNVQMIAVWILTA